MIYKDKDTDKYMNRIELLRKELSHIFDDNLSTSYRWHNYFDYLIISMIIISTVEVFLSTYPGIVEKYGLWLHIIDYTTIGLFTIEIILRIWYADLLDERYRGFKGRIRYCLSFYGLLDLLSVLPFYLSHFIKFPYSMLKVLRIARLIRIFRYMKAFGILKRAIRSKRNEIVVSIQFVVIVTLILSFLLFFVEHEAQPQVYDSCWKAIIWSFAPFIGDPGYYANSNPPVTSIGYLIVCTIGVLGIAIFAVPAGLIGSGFTEIMEEDRKTKKIKENINSILHSFIFNKDHQYTQLYSVPRYKSLSSIITQKFISESDIIEAVKWSECLHLYNLANAVNVVDHPHDRVVVINYKKNRPYGLFINRGSKITIVNVSGSHEPINGWLAYHIAKIGGFNYISKENEASNDHPLSYYYIKENNKDSNLRLFIDDINSLSQPGSWAITIMGAKSPRNHPTQIHFCKNADSISPNNRITNNELFDKLYNDIVRSMTGEFGYHCDKHIINTDNKRNLAYHINTDNVFLLSLECYIWMFDDRYMAVIKSLTDSLNRTLEPDKEKVLPQEMVTRMDEKDFGMLSYID